MKLSLLSKIKVKTSFFLMNKPLPYVLFGEPGKLVKKAKSEFVSIVDESLKHKYENKEFTVHVFNNGGSKKALVVHGWMSETVHLMMHIKHLVELGYEVYSIDFPSHAGNKGFKFSWKDAVKIILKTQKLYGNFDVGLGHSFGGGMMMNATGVSEYSSEFEGKFHADKFILISSALSINVPIRLFAGRLNAQESEYFKKLIEEDANICISEMSARSLQTKFPSNSKFLVIHGMKDKVVPVEESLDFAKIGEQVKLIKKENMNHFEVLYNSEVLKDITEFLK